MPSKDTVGQGHYDASYFNWQMEIGCFAAQAILFKYRPHVKPSDRVIDFGCGGGDLLKNLVCRERIGVEVNSAARGAAESKGIKTVSESNAIEDGWADVLISNSALEHVDSPLDDLMKLRRKVRLGGRVVFSLPHESISWKFSSGDINQHLYTWSPMSAGNLFNRAGLHVQKVSVVRHMDPPKAEFLYALLGEQLFGVASRLWRVVRLALSWARPALVTADIVVLAERLE